jgi:ketosteroid isomerase-like protein
MAAANVQASMAAAASRVSPTPREVVEAIQDAFRQGDYDRLAQLYDDDVDWLFHGPLSIFPEIGHRCGKVAVFKSFEALNKLYRFDHHVTDHLIADGEWVAGIADVTLVQRSSGRTIHCRIGSFHRIRNGRLVEYRGFMDSFDAAEQVLGHELLL